MIVTHTLQISARCPVDSLPDVYLCRVRTRAVLPVEDILAAVKKATAEARYQEEIAQALHRLLACEVELTGWHSGVFTRVVCGGEG